MKSLDLDLSVVDQIKEILRMRLHDSAEVLLAEMKLQVPVATGALRDSLGIEDQDIDTLIIGTDKEYAIFTELGTHNSPGKHWMSESISNVSDEMFSKMENPL